jgi:hypothetical protein
VQNSILVPPSVGAGLGVGQGVGAGVGAGAAARLLDELEAGEFPVVVLGLLDGALDGPEVVPGEVAELGLADGPLPLFASEPPPWEPAEPTPPPPPPAPPPPRDHVPSEPALRG